MSDRVQDLTNHRKVAVACKNYTDTEIKKSEERILSIVARNNVDFIDHTDEATYRFTAPANAKLMMLQSVGGNSVKYSPSVASDNNANHIKTLPSTVYDLDVSKVEGVGYKVNQLSPNTNSITLTTSKTDWLTHSIDNITINTSHKYLITIKINSIDSSVKIRLRYPKIVESLNIGVNTILVDSPNATIVALQYISNEGVIGSIVLPQNFINVFDLTTDFGSGNEPSTVSDCATEYAKRGINIYEYTPQQSSIKNNAFTGVKVEGVNKWDEQWEAGSINTDTGVLLPSVQYIRNKNKIKILPNTKYYATSLNNKQVVFYYYDVNDNYLGFVVATNLAKTTPSNAYWLRIRLDERPYNNDVCINISGSANGTYVPYTSQTIPIDLTTIKDSNNVSLFPSGKMMGNSSVADFITPYNQESRWNEIDLSTCEWTQVGATTSGYYVWRTTSITDIKYVANNTQVGNGVYSKGKIRMASGMTGNTDLYDLAIDTAQVSCVTTNGTTDKPTGILQYERATYLTSNTDLTSLTRINAQSNGTITLNNTDNVDMPNLISYNAIIKHALATAVKQDGFNVWDEETELGSLTIYGENYPDSNRIRSKNYIQVLPSSTYYFYTSLGSFARICAYDSAYNFIREITLTDNKATLGSNVKYLRFAMSTNYGTTYRHDICINISNQALNGTYKPYKAPITRLLPNSEAKYSWGITDGVRNTRVFCDDEGNAVNEGSLDVNSVDMGTLSYGKQYADTEREQVVTTDLASLISKPASASDSGNIVCTKYATTNSNDVYNHSANNIIAVGPSGNVTLYSSVLIGQTTSVIKSSVDGTPLFYGKNQVSTETLDDFDYFFDCEEGDTFTIIGCELLQCYATYSFLIKEAKSNE